MPDHKVHHLRKNISGRRQLDHFRKHAAAEKRSHRHDLRDKQQPDDPSGDLIFPEEAVRDCRKSHGEVYRQQDVEIPVRRTVYLVQYQDIPLHDAGGFFVEDGSFPDGQNRQIRHHADDKQTGYDPFRDPDPAHAEDIEGDKQDEKASAQIDDLLCQKRLSHVHCINPEHISKVHDRNEREHEGKIHIIMLMPPHHINTG